MPILTYKVKWVGREKFTQWHIERQMHCCLSILDDKELWSEEPPWDYKDCPYIQLEDYDKH